MVKKIAVMIMSVTFGLAIFSATFLQITLGLLKTDKKSNENDKVYYNNVYYAKAEENTGSSGSSSLYKGGAVYVGNGSTYSLTDATLKGNNNKYGGAVYVADGGIFVMNGGVLLSNSATYGGAIYVESGGVCRLTSAIIRDNMADIAPAIYVENGGTLEIDGTTVIQENYYLLGGYEISQDTIRVGHLTEGRDMHYLEYGTYPQTYVGNVMNTTLENWYQENNPVSVNVYTIRRTLVSTPRDWYAYVYTDGNMYARGYSDLRIEDTYKNGEAVIATDEIAWFKVEPIKWIVMNYDEVASNTAETIEVLSYFVLTSGICFFSNEIAENNCNIWHYSIVRIWLNSYFYENAFNMKERSKINLSTIQNNIPGETTVDIPTDGTGITTQDYIYYISRHHSFNKGFYDRIASPTDFVLSNYGYRTNEYPTAEYPNGGTTPYWTRSAADDYFAIYISSDGEAHRGGVTYYAMGSRPMMQLKI